MKDDKGQSPLDVALEEWYHEDNGCMNVALYLMSRGCACGDEDKAKLLCAACSNGNLGVVKELVEQHKIDPKSEDDNVLCFYKWPLLVCVHYLLLNETAGTKALL